MRDFIRNAVTWTTIVTLSLAVAGDVAAQTPLQKPSVSAGTPVPAPPQPPPTEADVSFGPHPHQLLDIYLPTEGTGPFPVLVWFGGLWEPRKQAPELRRFLSQGIAVVAVQSRTLKDGVAEKADPPVSYPMNDARRAVQFVRGNAARWKVDPRRIGVGGGSQGALPALFVGCSEDQADPKSDDPIARLSTRVTCVAAFRSQPSIDPQRMQEWVPGVQWGAPAFGCSFEESLRRREELLPQIRTWSPETLLHPGSAPIYFENNWGLTQPAGVTETDYKVHSPAWALGFQELAKKAGVECHVKYPDHPTEGLRDTWDFLVKKLLADPAV